MSLRNVSFGKRGEKMASDFLRKKGYKILSNHWSCHWGEIDIIAKEKGCLVFVEVKTRTGIRLGYPEEAITFFKKKSLQKASEFYLLQNPDFNGSLRFDVVSIVFDEKGDLVDIKLFKNAF